MRITNKFVSLDSIIDGPAGGRKQAYEAADAHAADAASPL
jgi:hypothetical protein